jgi:CBS domain-containing protein
MTLVFSVTKVKELMTHDPAFIGPEATLAEAAKKMADVDCGVLPVCAGRELIGIITDRDIVIRALARGGNPVKEKVVDHMTSVVQTCSANDTLEDAAEKMHQHKISRLVVTGTDDGIIGILSFGHVFRKDVCAHEIAEVLKHAAGPVCT